MIPKQEHIRVKKQAEKELKVSTAKQWNLAQWAEIHLHVF